MENTSILYLLTSSSIGLLLGFLCNAFFINRPNIFIKLILFFFGLMVVIFSIYYYCTDNIDNLLTKLLIPLSFILGVTIIIISIKLPLIRRYMTPKRLNKIINKHTLLADRNEIKLLGGDLSFFGAAPKNIEENEQYKALKDKNFNKIYVLCETPVQEETKIRYGKIISDFGDIVELKFYNPDEADLRIRGRLFVEKGVQKLLIFKKHSTKKYKAIATDTANEKGALYTNIWKLIWSLAILPSQVDIDKYKMFYEQNS